MPLYYGDYGIVNVQTGTVAVHHLPFTWVLVTGVAAPAAAAGAKTFAAKGRVRQQATATASILKSFGAVAGCKVTAVCDLHTSRVELAGSLGMRITAPRSELSAFASSTVTFVNAGTAVAGNNANVSPTAPTRNVGDLLIAFGFTRGAGTLSTSTGGWTAASTQFRDRTITFWRIADGTSADNITITYSGGSANDTVIGQIFAYRNTHTTTPFCARLDAGAAGSNLFENQQAAVTSTFSIKLGGDSTDPTNYNTDVVTGAMVVAYVGLANDETGGVPTLTDPGGNSSGEAALFPFTRRSIFATTLGADASLMAFDASNAGAEMADYAAAGTVNFTVASTNAYGVSGAIRPSSTGGPNVNVWLDGAMAGKVSLTGTLNSQTQKQLDGVLGNVVTATCTLTAGPGKLLDGSLACKVSTLCSLNVVNNRMEAVLRIRSVGNLAQLTVGTNHHPAALLQNKVSLTGTLTTNYMQALLRTSWSASCNFDVNVRLAASAGVRQSASADLTVGRTYAAVVGLRQTAAARLTMPLRGDARCRITATTALAVQRQIAGVAALRQTAVANEDVGRRFQMSVGLRQTAVATLTASRLLAAHAPLRQSASVALSLDHRLAGFLACRITARLALDVAYPAPKLVPTEITVTPDTTLVEQMTLPCQVESAHDAANVEDGE